MGRAVGRPVRRGARTIASARNTIPIGRLTASHRKNRITAMPPLLEHLYRQLGEIGGLAPEECAIAEYIIGNIDEPRLRWLFARRNRR